MKAQVQRTVYPFGYNKNVASDRNHKKFTVAFNRWAQYIREATLPTESIMNDLVKQAKVLIG